MAFGNVFQSPTGVAQGFGSNPFRRRGPGYRFGQRLAQYSLGNVETPIQDNDLYAAILRNNAIAAAPRPRPLPESYFSPQRLNPYQKFAMAESNRDPMLPRVPSRFVPMTRPVKPTPFSGEPLVPMGRYPGAVKNPYFRNSGSYR